MESTQTRYQEGEKLLDICFNQQMKTKWEIIHIVLSNLTAISITIMERLNFKGRKYFFKIRFLKLQFIWAVHQYILIDQLSIKIVFTCFSKFLLALSNMTWNPPR